MTNNTTNNSNTNNIKSVSGSNPIIEISTAIKNSSNLNAQIYAEYAKEANEDYANFWYKLAKQNLAWDIPPIKSVDTTNAPFFTWFDDGELSVSYNCLDKHLHNGNKNKIALIFEDDAGNVSKVTYEELLVKVCHMANAIKDMGFKQGDRAIIYMPMSIEAVVAMHACVRLGIIHSVVFAGFSAKSLQERIIDAGASLIFTADMQYRGGKPILVKQNVDEALNLGGCESIKKVIVYQRNKLADVVLRENEHLWHDVVKNQEDFCPAIPLNAEHPLFILYTSGSTGKPKGVQHSSAGYLLHAILTMQWTFDIKPQDIFWCTADIGWITGHTYVAYGPMAVGATQVIFEGVPTYPNASRFWQMIQTHKVSIFYTAPTAIRALIKANSNDESTHPKNFDLSSLRLLGSVGEPINPEAWQWYYENVGNNICPIVDTWWQTETGGHIMTPLIGVDSMKAGSCVKPIVGIDVAIVDENNQAVEKQNGGYLVIKKPWPSMIRNIWNDSERFKSTYFPAQFGGNVYLAGDGAMQDEDGYYWIMGRIDDVLNVSGHRLGTIEIESSLVAHHEVAEAAVVGCPDDITGEAIIAFVSLKYAKTTEQKQELEQELKAWVAKQIGSIAKPKQIRFGDSLPKTRSGKIMRRLLRSIAKNEEITQDISTLENVGVLEQFMQHN
ncbi:MAG: acetate--CoA ligase [Pseudomonadota bacterium]|jgi:acetyl-CoA synthetase